MSDEAFSLAGKVALITGSTRGIGAAIAEEFAAAGASLVVTGRRPSEAQAVAERIQERGGEAQALAYEAAEDGAPRRLADAVGALHNKLDILVNNAGILRDKSFTKMEMSDFNLVVDVHLMGSVKPTRAVSPIMKEQGYGRIIVPDSSSGLYGNFVQTNTAHAKLALSGFLTNFCP